LVLLAKPRLAAGDVDSLRSVANRYATMFNLTIMAAVTANEEGGDVRYRLGKIGVGFSVPVRGKQMVITSGTAEKLGAELDFISRRVLAGNEAALNQVVQVARHANLSVFDAGALFTRRGKHQDMTVRYVVWVSPNSGKISTMVWLLEADQQRRYRLADGTLRLLSPAFIEDRVVHVMGSEVTFGIPTEQAFSLVRLPQGKPVRATSQLARLAATRRFTPANLAELEAALREAAPTFGQLD
jgi:hypothetical protein